MGNVLPGRVDPSVLYRSPQDETAVEPSRPTYFSDLHLDQIIDAVLAKAEGYSLASFFHSPLPTCEAIAYRQAVMKDLERAEIALAIQAFSRQMKSARAGFERASKSHYSYESKRWLVEAGRLYGEAVRELTESLETLEPNSEGLRNIRDYLGSLLASPTFRVLERDVSQTLEGLRSVRYTTRFKDGVTVQRYDEETDCSTTIAELFAKFRQEATTDYLARFPAGGDLNHVEAMILDRVALLYPAAFAALDAYCERHADPMDHVVIRFDREIQFYLAYRAHIEPMKKMGLQFSYPEVSCTVDIRITDAFDMALAVSRGRCAGSVVRNDVALMAQERILVVTGPNHGGKTTYARMIGQIHYLAALGFPVPCKQACLFAFDRMFTHFEKPEDITTLRGKLLDDLVRVHAILDSATPRSLIILNEIFASTSLEDAVLLSRRVLTKISSVDAVAVCVTFLAELSTLNDKTVSVVSTTDAANPSVPTYHLVRRAADGIAYALAVADKHRVTRDWLLRRIAA